MTSLLVGLLRVLRSLEGPSLMVQTMLVWFFFICNLPLHTLMLIPKVPVYAVTHLAADLGLPSFCTVQLHYGAECARVHHTQGACQRQQCLA